MRNPAAYRIPAATARPRIRIRKPRNNLRNTRLAKSKERRANWRWGSVAIGAWDGWVKEGTDLESSLISSVVAGERQQRDVVALLEPTSPRHNVVRDYGQ